MKTRVCLKYFVNDCRAKKFLRVEQADRMKTKEVYDRVPGEVKRRMKLLISEINNEKFIGAIIIKVVPIAEKNELNRLNS